MLSSDITKRLWNRILSSFSVNCWIILKYFGKFSDFIFLCQEFDEAKILRKKNPKRAKWRHIRAKMSISYHENSGVKSLKFTARFTSMVSVDISHKFKGLIGKWCKQVLLGLGGTPMLAWPSSMIYAMSYISHLMPSRAT